MKKFLLLLLVIGLGIFGVYYYTIHSMANVANDFFESVKAKNMVQAEKYLSKGFRKNTTQAQLQQYLMGYKLNSYKELEWNDKKITDLKTTIFWKNGSLDGTLVSKDNVSSHIKLKMLKESGEWKIFALEKVLSKKEILQQKLLREYTLLARSTMHTLGKAVKDDNMTILYNNISKVWQKEISVKKLKKTYGVFVKKKVNFLPLDKFAPALTKAQIAKNGLLTLGGYYRLDVNKTLYFDYKYVPENKVWKLAGLSIEFK